MPSRVYQQLQEAHALPSPTGVALELLRLSSDPNATLDAVGAVVEADPAFAGRLLKLVNSPFTGVARRVASISLAVRLLGLRIVKNLALGLSLVSSNRNGRCRSFNYARFWSRSLGRAVAAGELAALQRDFPADEAFTAGLLAEVGQLALATACPAELARILDSTDPHDVPALLTAQEEAFGINHFELSAEMMAGWHLQDLFCNAVKALSAPAAPTAEETSRCARLARSLNVAGTMAVLLSDPEAPPAVAARLDAEALALGLSAEVMQETFDRVAEHWREAGQVFSISTRDVLAFDQLRSQAESARDGESAEPAEALLSDTADALARSGGPERLRVLIVDDDPAGLALLERQLRQAGYDVLTACNGEEALEIERTHAPPMIITDWMMPGIDGIELCRRLRHHPHCGFVYLIVVTAGLEANLAVEALEAGADDFLSKPYNHLELLARVRAGERIVRLEARLAERSREIAVFNTRLTAANEQLRMVASTDALTGLPNRREAMTRLAELWSLAERHGAPLACIVGDIDYFKRFNDRHGHAGGDAVLKAVAEVLVRSRRAGEAVYRIGGEEFLIICPRATREQARVAAERARAAVAQCEVPGQGGALSVTISLGVAERTPGMRHAGDLLDAADAAMYAAKNAGRNRVGMAGGAACAAPADDPSARKSPDPRLGPVCPALVELAIRLLAAEDAATVGALTVAAAGELAHCRRALLFLPDHATRTLSVAGTYGVDPAGVARLRVPFGECLVGRVFTTGEPLVLNRPEDSSASAATSGDNLLALVPPLICRVLPGEGGPVGVLHLCDPRNTPGFLPEELAAIEQLSRLAGAALAKQTARLPS